MHNELRILVNNFLFLAKLVSASTVFFTFAKNVGERKFSGTAAKILMKTRIRDI